MNLDDRNLRDLKEATDSYISLAELAEKLQADYQELLKKFEKQSCQLEEINVQLTDALALNSRLSAYLNNILEHLEAGVVVFDSDERISTFNGAAENLTGIEREYALARKYSDVFPGDEHSHTLNLLKSQEIRVKGEKWFGNQPVGYSSSRIL